MVDPLQYLDKLAERARQEQVPQGDVSRAVLDRISRRPQAAIPWLVFAGSCVALATVATVLGFVVIETMNDPLSLLFQSASAVLP